MHESSWWRTGTYRKLKYAVTGQEVKQICMQKHIKVDGKVRTDNTYPVGFQDVLTIEKPGDAFRLLYDTKGRFRIHKISAQLPFALLR